MGFSLKKLFGGKSEPVSFASLKVDMHSHLIPGIDDGAKDMEDSIAMIKALHELGYQKLITTPHIMSDFYKNTPEIILGGLEKVKARVREEGIDIELEAAAEYYVDENFEKLLAGGDLLTFGGEKKYLLFETSYTSRPMALESTVFEMNAAGYFPVMAHPERYAYLWDKSGDKLEEFKAMGMKFQVNLGSFAGSYHVRAKKTSEILFKHELIDFVATDLHRMPQLPSLTHGVKKNTHLRTWIENGGPQNKEL